MNETELMQEIERRRNKLLGQSFDLEATVLAQLSQNHEIPAIARMQAKNASVRHINDKIKEYETAMRVIFDISSDKQVKP
jgi:hypothetical protein